MASFCLLKPLRRQTSPICAAETAGRARKNILMGSVRPSILPSVRPSPTHSPCFLSDVAALLHAQSAEATAAEVPSAAAAEEDGGDEKVEGRFFLKDKLCALGLANVRS